MKDGVFRRFVDMFAGGIGVIAGLSLMYFCFDFSMREAISSMLGAEMGLLITGFLIDRTTRNKKLHA